MIHYIPNNNVSNEYVYDELYKKYSKKYCLNRLICPFYDKKFAKIDKNI